MLRGMIRKYASFAWVCFRGERDGVSQRSAPANGSSREERAMKYEEMTKSTLAMVRRARDDAEAEDAAISAMMRKVKRN